MIHLAAELRGRTRYGLHRILGVSALTAALFIASSAMPVSADQTLSVHLVDQLGNEIPGSVIYFGSTMLRTGESVSLPVDEPVLARLHPGFDGLETNVDCILCRYEEVTIADGQTRLDFEWITTSVVVDLTDQAGLTIPNSTVALYRVGNLSPPATISLPINDATVYPGVASNRAFEFSLRPGVNGYANADCGLLCRTETIVVAEATDRIDFEWRTKSLKVDLVDQRGATIPGSVLAGFRFGAVSPGDSLTLPVSVDPDHPGLVVNGAYTFSLRPGLNDLPTNADCALCRSESFAVSETTDTLDFEWATVECPLGVARADSSRVAGSMIELPSRFGSYSPGDVVVLPVTDYPSAAGPYASGYPMTVHPGDSCVGPRTLTFEVGASGDFVPPQFEIDDRAYSLICDNGLAAPELFLSRFGYDRPMAAWSPAGGVGMVRVRAMDDETVLMTLVQDPDEDELGVHGDPIPGIDVAVEQIPGGSMLPMLWVPSAAGAPTFKGVDSFGVVITGTWDPVDDSIEVRLSKRGEAVGGPVLLEASSAPTAGEKLLLLQVEMAWLMGHGWPPHLGRPLVNELATARTHLEHDRPDRAARSLQKFGEELGDILAKAAGDPIPGIDVAVEQNPGGSMILDASGIAGELSPSSG